MGYKQDRWTEICQAQAVRGSAHGALQDLACPWGPHPTGRWRGGRKLPDAGRAQRPPENTQCHTWGQPDKATQAWGCLSSGTGEPPPHPVLDLTVGPSAQPRPSRHDDAGPPLSIPREAPWPSEPRTPVPPASASRHILGPRVDGWSTGSLPQGSGLRGLTVGRFHLKSWCGKGQAGARPQSCL